MEESLARGRNAMAIDQDLVDRHGFTAKYASVKALRFFCNWLTSPLLTCGMSPVFVILPPPGTFMPESD
jgi:hypothetical protein